MPNWPQRKEDTQLPFGVAKAGGNGANCYVAAPAEELNFHLRAGALLKAGSSSVLKAGLTHLAPKEGCEAPTVYPHGGGSMPPETLIHILSD